MRRKKYVLLSKKGIFNIYLHFRSNTQLECCNNNHHFFITMFCYHRSPLSLFAPQWLFFFFINTSNLQCIYNVTIHLELKCVLMCCLLGIKIEFVIAFIMKNIYLYCCEWGGNQLFSSWWKEKKIYKPILTPGAWR